MANLVYERAGFATIVGPNLLLAADHPDRGKTQSVIVLPHEPDIIGFARPRDQSNRSQFSPLVNGVINPLRAWDIRVDNKRDHTARPPVPVGGRLIGRLDLIEKKETKNDCHGLRPNE
jgi:hypothetical protein